MAYWVIHQDQMRSMLERARAGEDIDLLCIEFYAGSDVQWVPPADRYPVEGYGGPDGSDMPGPG